ncbi:MAG TPA: dienelactone hydrolase family protein [Candidatus Acidoferrales bacterium]|nr:dienelactone hydrolase family protein [Candidatus Acidoferrales bacterium]
MPQTGSREPSGLDREITIAIGNTTLSATLTIPDRSKGIVLFAHGSGSSRHSRRNRYVAGVLQSSGMATLLLDLLTPDEEAVDERTAELRFDIPLLADRLVVATQWLEHTPATKDLGAAYFGASTGAAAALIAAARLHEAVSAVVSRGGRPDLAKDFLRLVRAPTLLIVGGNDQQVLELNQWACDQLSCAKKKLVIVPGATHLFEEPGALGEVAHAAADWFGRFIGTSPGGTRVLASGARA